jgi:hypothetical protein
MRDRGHAKDETPSTDTEAVYRIEGMTIEWVERPLSGDYGPMCRL